MTVDDALIPLEVVRERYGVPASTLRRWLTREGIRSVQYGTERAVRWADIEHLTKIGLLK